jgi:heme-degrading monooxygenase HmoA
MFTRVVEIASKPGKAAELTKAVEEKVIPFLKTQPGFLDEITMFSDMNPNLMLAISFWKTKDDAERYHQEQYKLVTQALDTVLESAPTIHTFFVANSTLHNIASTKAA